MQNIGCAKQRRPPAARTEIAECTQSGGEAGDVTDDHDSGTGIVGGDRRESCSDAGNDLVPGLAVGDPLVQVSVDYQGPEHKGCLAANLRIV